MKSRKSVWSTTHLAVALLLIGLGSAASAHDEDPPRILVTGHGTASISPDMAVVSLTVTRQADTAREALSANSEAMGKVLDAMAGLGIAKRDMQTSNFSIQPRYSRPARQNNGASEAPKIVGHTVRNGLTLRVRDIDKVGEVLDTAVTLGVNEGGSIRFTNSDASDVLTQARVKAVEQAQKKATTLAEAAGLRLGQILEIVEQSHNSRPMAMGRSEMRLSSAADSVPVAAGENAYQVDVTVSYAIEYYPSQLRSKQ